METLHSKRTGTNWGSGQGPIEADDWDLAIVVLVWETRISGLFEEWSRRRLKRLECYTSDTCSLSQQVRLFHLYHPNRARPIYVTWPLTWPLSVNKMVGHRSPFNVHHLHPKYECLILKQISFLPSAYDSISPAILTHHTRNRSFQPR